MYVARKFININSMHGTFTQACAGAACFLLWASALRYLEVTPQKERKKPRASSPHDTKISHPTHSSPLPPPTTKPSNPQTTPQPYPKLYALVPVVNAAVARLAPFLAGFVPLFVGFCLLGMACFGRGTVTFATFSQVCGLCCSVFGGVVLCVPTHYG